MSNVQNIVYAGSSEYGDYRIVDMTYEDRPARVLFSGENAGQSGIALDDEPELLFDYNQRFLEIAESLRPSRILIIGGGAFTLPTTLVERFPDSLIDVVEIDDLLYQLAKQYFKASTSERLHVFTADGRSFIDGADTEYDLIILDAFSGYTIPHQLITVEAAASYKRLLQSDGVLAINFISSYRSLRTNLSHELFTTFAERFNSVQVFPADRNYWTHAEQNLLLVCAEQAPNVDYLQSCEVTLAHIPADAVLRDAE